MVTEEQREAYEPAFELIAKQMRLEGGIEDRVKEVFIDDGYHTPSELPTGKPKGLWTVKERDEVADWILRVRKLRRRYHRDLTGNNAGTRRIPVPRAHVKHTTYSNIQDIEREYARADALVTAHKVGQLPIVQAFWGNWFDGQVLKPIDALRVINQIKRKCRPLEQIKSSMLLESDDPMSWWDGSEDPGIYRSLDTDATEMRKIRSSFVDAPPVVNRTTVPVPDILNIDVDRLSHDLRKVVQEVALHTGWSKPQCCGFALTGRAPFREPVQVTVTTLTGLKRPEVRISVEVRDWISRDTAEQAFHKYIGNKGRRPGAAAFEAFQFAFPRRDAAPTEQPYEAIFQEWKRVHHGVVRITDWRRFRRNYLEILDLLDGDHNDGESA